MGQNKINNSSSEFTIDNLFIDGNTISSTDTNGNIVLAPDGTGVISVTSAPIVPSGDRAENLGSASNNWDNIYLDGLSFNDGTDIMSYYEIGTWTPVLTYSPTSDPPTYDVQVGNYIRIGDLVYFNCYLLLNYKGTGSGNAKISGLPYPSAASTYNNFILACGDSGFRGVGNDYFRSGMSSGSGLISLAGQGNASIVTLRNTEFVDTSDFRISGVYQA